MRLLVAAFGGVLGWGVVLGLVAAVSWLANRISEALFSSGAVG